MDKHMLVWIVFIILGTVGILMTQPGTLLLGAVLVAILLAIHYFFD